MNSFSFFVKLKTGGNPRKSPPTQHRIMTSYYLPNGTQVKVLSQNEHNSSLYEVEDSSGNKFNVFEKYLFEEKPETCYDEHVRPLYIGSRFLANGKFWQIIGFSSDGRPRDLEFVRGLDLTHLMGYKGRPIDRLQGPAYLFRGYQINQRHGEAPYTFQYQCGTYTS